MSTSTAQRTRRVALTSITVALIAAMAVASGISARSAAPSAAQVARGLVLDLDAIDDDGRKPSDSVLDSRLSQLTEIQRREGDVAALRFAKANGITFDSEGRARVLIHERAAIDYEQLNRLGDDPEQRIGRATLGEEALFEAIEVAIRGEVEGWGGAVTGRVGNMIDASLPLASLRYLDGGSGIGMVEPAPVPHPTVVSEGVSVIQADDLQNSTVAYQPTGPLRVGVIDLGFEGWDELVGSELPTGTTVQSFSEGGINGNGLDILDQVHGTACAEIIFDVAPEAQIFLSNFDSISTNDEAFDWMIAQDVDVISYSIGWFNAGPGDGRGPINDAVRRATAAGIEVVVSAGNEARAHYMDTFTDPDDDGLHSYSPGDESNAITLSAGDTLTVFLNWDDWFASDQDYDLYILDSNDNVVASSTNFQTGTQNPAETAGFEAATGGTYHVVVQKFSATRDVELQMFFSHDPAKEMQYVTPAGSITIPADTEEAVVVGATFWGNDQLEDFSSQGPTKDGRVKPDLMGPDGVTTRSYGDLGLDFFGTSASAPHVAGAIALMKSRFGVYQLRDIVDILEGRAIDMGLQGKDNVFGHGRVDIKGG